MHLLCTPLNHARDEYEALLIKKAIDKKIPIFLICRGLQMANALFGGTLYQDLSIHPEVTIKHSAIKEGQKEIHSVEIADKNSFFYQVMNEDSVYVNSMHHQAIKDLAPIFKSVAKSRDGIVEVVEAKNSEQFIFGAQFHPEIMGSRYGGKMLELFKGFVEIITKEKNLGK